MRTSIFLGLVLIAAAIEDAAKLSISDKSINALGFITAFFFIVDMVEFYHKINKK